MGWLIFSKSLVETITTLVGQGLHWDELGNVFFSKQGPGPSLYTSKRFRLMGLTEVY